MKKLIAGFSKQIADAIQIAEAFILPSAKAPIDNILICGLGGSGIGGSIIAQLVSGSCPVPVTVCKDYDLPGFVGKKTLVIISSYSGNTEETLACLNTAVERGCTIVCITSGGTVEKIAQEKNLGLIRVPGGMPPRACLGYSLVQLFYIFNHFGFLVSDFRKDLKASVELLDTKEKVIIDQAEKISAEILHKFPVIYSCSQWEGVMIRFRQQLNENSKILCTHHVIPEMNHNELVGWRTTDQDLVVMLFRDRDEFERNDMRIRIVKEVVSAYTPNLIEIWSEGRSAIEKTFWFIHLGDWVSVLLAEKRGVDPVEVKVIDHLKSELGKK